MRDRAKTKIRVVVIPPELCTYREVCEILGFTSNCSGSAISSERFRSLQVAYVVYKGNRIRLFNRKAVEALKYKPHPADYVTTKEAAKLLGFSKTYNYAPWLRKHGIPHKWIKAHHSYYVWKKTAVEKLKQEREALYAALDK